MVQYEISSIHEREGVSSAYEFIYNWYYLPAAGSCALTGKEAMKNNPNATKINLDIFTILASKRLFFQVRDASILWLKDGFARELVTLYQLTYARTG